MDCVSAFNKRTKNALPSIKALRTQGLILFTQYYVQFGQMESVLNKKGEGLSFFL